MINIKLDTNAINFILQTLGELPTKTGAWDLVKLIKEQVDQQELKKEITTEQLKI